MLVPEQGLVPIRLTRDSTTPNVFSPIDRGVQRCSVKSLLFLMYLSVVLFTCLGNNYGLMTRHTTEAVHLWGLVACDQSFKYYHHSPNE